MGEKGGGSKQCFELVVCLMFRRFLLQTMRQGEHRPHRGQSMPSLVTRFENSLRILHIMHVSLIVRKCDKSCATCKLCGYCDC